VYFLCRFLHGDDQQLRCGPRYHPACHPHHGWPLIGRR